MLREKKKCFKKFRKQCWKFGCLAKKNDLDRKQQRMPDLRAAACAELPGMGPNPCCGSQVINRNEMIFIVPEEKKAIKFHQRGWKRCTDMSICKLQHFIRYQFLSTFTQNRLPQPEKCWLYLHNNISCNLF